MRKSVNESMNLSLNLTPFEPRGLPKMVKMANIRQKFACILMRYQGFPLNVTILTKVANLTKKGELSPKFGEYSYDMAKTLFSEWRFWLMSSQKFK